ncbi:MAG: hypothetical protein WCJ29_01040 [bacterium]
MRTLFLAFVAFWLTATTVFFSSSLDYPFDSLSLVLPFAILIAIVGSTHESLRFTLFCGTFLMIMQPSSNFGTVPCLILATICSSAFFRMTFSLPTLGALMASGLIGCVIFEILNYVLLIPNYFAYGFPEALPTFLKVLVRITFTLIVVALGGNLYNRVALRFKRAFLGAV